MITVGLTGGIGAGKSIVARILIEMGYKIFNSDLEARQIMNNDPLVRRQLIELLGEGIYTPEGLNRTLVAEKIFSDHQLREQINAIVHPVTRAAFEAFKDDLANQKDLVFNEAAILFETGAYKRFDKVVLVIAPEELRLKRVMTRDNSSETETKARIKAQWSDEEKIKLADFTIVNDEKKPLLKQIESMINSLR